MDEVRIFIMKQAKGYIANGLQPLRIEYDAEHDNLVFVFDKKESQPLYYKWVNRDMKYINY